MAHTMHAGSSHGQALQELPFKTSMGSLRVMLLHGNLDVWIMEAKNLPNMIVLPKTLGDMFGRFGKLTTKLEGHMPSKITCDPYMTVSVSGAKVGRTFVIANSENPVWNQHFNIPVAHKAAEVHFVVKNNGILGSQLIGAVGIPVEQLCSGVRIEGVFPILSDNRKPCKPGAVLTLSIQFTPTEKVSLYQGGLASNPENLGVPGTYFPPRKGGKVTLYQDAHEHDSGLPSLELDEGIRYEHSNCWSDIYNAISQARHLVYIVGWSVVHTVTLVRNNDNGAKSMLGDLLKTKSQEGVRVLLLVWDDPTSRTILGFKKDGVMKTCDEETRRFFKHSSVQVMLCPRSAEKGHSWIKKQEVGVIYSHHQKTVIVDADAGDNRRKIVAFVGGLDLSTGRYDTPHHHLFRTLQTVHSDDFHNPTFAEPSVGCPREPWHDLHCQIDGPAAYDILTNFEERWLRAYKQSKLSRLKASSDDQLLRFEIIHEFVSIEEVSSQSQKNPESWNVQIFRSIDSTSVKGFPSDPKEATNKNLVCGKNLLIDMSIHTAYVKAIRSAQHFIYIENQYFLGSSYNWSSSKYFGANNLIPIEIALKIVNKIKANERFAAYIVVPMWPEGPPTSFHVQRILFWQRKTMEMMYEMIYDALREVGLENTYEPQDYLNFFCLGNREAPDGTISSTNRRSLGVRAAEKTPQALSQKNRRFMIYVHSKGMIVDDEYVLMGSANINERSMEGTRDTEIAMGAYQPRHTWSKKGSTPHGQVYGYRMSLWAEHIGDIEERFKRPESVECVRRVRYLSEQNWGQYIAEVAAEMKGHLLKYPLEVDKTGKVSALPGCETFPDVGGNILGTLGKLGKLGSSISINENLTI